jgi:AcrR family transcriptional regulator
MMDPVTSYGSRALRRDAAENRDKILEAARASFDEEGFEIGMEAIAQRAGVGVGTVYRRFPTKELLIAAVVDEVLAAIRDAALAASDHESSTEGLTEYLFTVGRLQFEHAGCLPRLWNGADDAVRREIEAISRQLLAKAQATGSVRGDVVYEDIATIFWSLQGVIERTATVAPDAWKRHLDLLIQSLTQGDIPLAHAPLTTQQAERVKRESRRGLSS